MVLVEQHHLVGPGGDGGQGYHSTITIPGGTPIVSTGGGFGAGYNRPGGTGGSGGGGAGGVGGSD